MGSFRAGQWADPTGCSAVHRQWALSGRVPSQRMGTTQLWSYGRCWGVMQPLFRSRPLHRHTHTNTYSPTDSDWSTAIFSTIDPSKLFYVAVLVFYILYHSIFNVYLFIYLVSSRVNGIMYNKQNKPFQDETRPLLFSWLYFCHFPLAVQKLSREEMCVYKVCFFICIQMAWWDW